MDPIFKARIRELREQGASDSKIFSEIEAFEVDQSLKKIDVIPNFLSKEHCEEIIKFVDKQPLQAENGEDKFKGKTFPWGQVRNIDNHGNWDIAKIISSFRVDATLAARKFYNKDNIYPEYTDIVLWKNGEDMGLHADSYEFDGNPRDTRGSKHDWRFCGGVLYLNDDYEGGETYFSKFKVQVRPETGKFSLFSSDWNHMHGVRRIMGGREPWARYTMPIWFTEDYTKCEV